MERFIYEVENPQTREILSNSIQGRGAFARFKDVLYRHNLDQEGYEFKGREDRKETLEWLLSLDLIDEDDIELGMQLQEDSQNKKKQRESDIADMVKCVKCIENVGHLDKLTIDKTFEVLDERKEHLNIRIEDDRRKVVWMPKSHFDLIR
jgi:hypothetical protein